MISDWTDHWTLPGSGQGLESLRLMSRPQTGQLLHKCLLLEGLVGLHIPFLSNSGAGNSNLAFEILLNNLLLSKVASIVCR